MEDRKTILSFIEGFRQFDTGGALTTTFTSGYCYWFARILADRFDANIQYEPIEGHFVAELYGRLYDIRGDVTELYADAKVWYSEEYCLEIPSIVNGCILKVPYDWDDVPA